MISTFGTLISAFSLWSAPPPLPPPRPVSPATTQIGVIGFSVTAEVGNSISPAKDPRLVSLFTKQNGKWGATPPNLPDTDWWEVFDGMTRAKLVMTRKNDFLADPDKSRYERARRFERRLEDANQTTIDRLGRRVRDGLNLFATTRPNVTDPAGWRRVRVGAATADAAKAQFIAKFKFRRECPRDPSDPDWHVTKVTTQKLTAADVTVDARAFTSRTSRILVGVYPKLPVCIDDPYVINQFFQKHWYVVQANEVRELAPDPERRGSLEPIEAADFDGDGQSEWVFRENGSQGGDMGATSFILFDANFIPLASADSPLPGVNQEQGR